MCRTIRRRNGTRPISTIRKWTLKKSSMITIRPAPARKINLPLNIQDMDEASSFWEAELKIKAASAMVPESMVTASWLILPRMVSEIALIRNASSTYNIRPPYSPIRLGVSMVILHPANTALREYNKENF